MTNTRIRNLIISVVGGAAMGAAVWYFNQCSGGECAKTQIPGMWIGGGAVIGLFSGWFDTKGTN